MTKNDESKTVYKTVELTADKVDEHTTHKADGEEKSYEKVTFQNLPKTIVVTLKMDQIPPNLREGSKAVIAFLKEQTTLDEHTDEEDEEPEEPKEETNLEDG